MIYSFVECGFHIHSARFKQVIDVGKARAPILVPLRMRKCHESKRRHCFTLSEERNKAPNLSPPPRSIDSLFKSREINNNVFSFLNFLFQAAMNATSHSLHAALAGKIHFSSVNILVPDNWTAEDCNTNFASFHEAGRLQVKFNSVTGPPPLNLPHSGHLNWEIILFNIGDWEWPLNRKRGALYSQSICTPCTVHTVDFA